jgi:hypothetical protein
VRSIKHQRLDRIVPLARAIFDAPSRNSSIT